MSTDDALVAVADAVARVLDVDPSVLRPDTPLADLGADRVALSVIADILAESGVRPLPAPLLDPARARVSDLLPEPTPTPAAAPTTSSPAAIAASRSQG